MNSPTVQAIPRGGIIQSIWLGDLLSEIEVLIPSGSRWLGIVWADFGNAYHLLTIQPPDEVSSPENPRGEPNRWMVKPYFDGEMVPRFSFFLGVFNGYSVFAHRATAKKE